jgi:hypothetical protein
MFAIAHKGQELGQFSIDQIRQLLADGAIDESAFYWREGMAEWQPLASLFPTQPQAPPQPLHVLETKIIVQWDDELADTIKAAFCAALKVKKYESTFEFHVLSDIYGNKEFIVVAPASKNRIPAELAVILGPAFGLPVAFAIATGQAISERMQDRNKVSPDELAAAAKDVVIISTPTCKIRANEVVDDIALSGFVYMQYLYIDGVASINGLTGRVSMKIAHEVGSSLGRYLKPKRDWIGDFCAALGKEKPPITRGKIAFWGS